MSKPAYKRNDVFFHKEEKKFFIVDSVEHSIGPKGNGWLYAMYSPAKTDDARHWKRCYENDIKLKYIPVDGQDSELVKILYGT